jgi:hypothetical protein
VLVCSPAIFTTRQKKTRLGGLADGDSAAVVYNMSNAEFAGRIRHFKGLRLDSASGFG